MRRQVKIKGEGEGIRGCEDEGIGLSFNYRERY
jgi:hypothetical protein